MPQKSSTSQQKTKVVTRKPNVKVTPTENISYYYNTLEDIEKRGPTLKSLQNWNVDTSNNVVLKLWDSNFSIPIYEILIDEILSFWIMYFGWHIPDHHTIYKQFKRSVRNVTVSELIKEVFRYNICQGHGFLEDNNTIIIHSVQLIS